MFKRLVGKSFGVRSCSPAGAARPEPVPPGIHHETNSPGSDWKLPEESKRHSGGAWGG